MSTISRRYGRRTSNEKEALDDVRPGPPLTVSGLRRDPTGACYRGSVD